MCIASFACSPQCLKEVNRTAIALTWSPLPWLSSPRNGGTANLAREAHRTVRSLKLHSESELLQEQILMPSLLLFSRQFKTQMGMLIKNINSLVSNPSDSVVLW